MKTIRFDIESSLGLALLLAIAGAASARGQDAAALRQRALALVKPLPAAMPGGEADTPARVALGKKLYSDNRLSKNNSQSCNTCHAVDKGRAGVDNEPTSPGAFGKRGDRNSPTTLNAGFHLAQFWDGRAPTLQEQAKGPVLNPVEMSMPDEATVVERLRADKQYGRMFAQAYPGQAQPITYDNMAEAISAFERTLITRDRFDEFLNGKDKALTPLEVKGLDTFLTVGCTTCHYGPTLGGQLYQKMGLVKPYANQSDLGRYNVTKEDGDKMKFKVPSLRNVAATHPYFHDGKVASLHDAVRTMASIQLSLTLSPEQEENLLAFLKSLTGKGLSVAKSQ